MYDYGLSNKHNIVIYIMFFYLGNIKLNFVPASVIEMYVNFDYSFLFIYVTA